MTEVRNEPAAAPAAAGLPPRSGARSTAGGGRKRKWNLREAATGWLFVLPFAVLLVAFLLLPMAYAFKISLYRSTLVEGEVFAYFDNYKQAFDDPLVREGVVRVLIFGLIQTPLMIGIALLAALLIDAATSRFSRFFRLAAFVPYAVPVVIGTLMWGFLYSENVGPLSGLVNVDFLSGSTVLASLGNIVTWQWAGYNMIVLYAALQGLPREIYESAKMDGAGQVQIALRIKTPMISSALVLATLFTIMGTLQFFTEPLILQPLNPGAITQHYTPNLYAFNQAFSFQQYNYSAAISFLLGAVVFVGSYIFLFATRKRSALR
ncbi:putative ABC transporter permease protein [Actinoplanes missouriensis 431]|uniref:Putative ABC transporter permease protein n=1 Tax=Actinoplanes missouriensis (strain ATCC 14538 / DSM 43046 / CBS 188.64 / JCM 3121 / NBRC 102363 / NCIMB 12654 / NRRL B-3342 / UNCC 431) TaxID=512565 RepID=I0HG39_ACTM4|nr:sugar ABC transporter permease [Actinoplanes missouriensis]BAL91976.1 putative ABC transporter permease protein [Actinoplanes missouriensis 431]